jgi:chromosome segregation ATPase
MDFLTTTVSICTKRTITPKIPDGARRAANALLEQMWAIAYGHARSPLVNDLASVRAELEAEKQLVQQRTGSLEQLQVAYGGLAEQVRALQGQLDEAKRIHQIDLIDAEKQVQALQSVAAEKERLFQTEIAAERQRGDQMANRHEEAMAQARQAHQAALDRMDRQLEAEVQRAAAERAGQEQRVEVALADVRQWTTATLAAQADVQKLTQDLGQTRLELAGAKTEVVEQTKLAEERQVTVYGMAGDLEKARERDAAVWLPRLKEFGLRLEREPEAELVRPTWLDADVWERGVLPMVKLARVSKT